MATMASVKVFAPFAAYPSFASVRNRNWLRTDTSYKPEGVEVTYLNYPALPAISRPFNGLTCARTVLPHVEREHVDVILSYWLYPDAYAATIVGKRLGIPVVSKVIGSDLNVVGGSSKWLAKQTLMRSSMVLTVSEALRDKVIALGIPADKVVTIANGCDERIFYLRERDEARTAVGFASSRKMVLYAGRLDVLKGLRELVQAFAVGAMQTDAELVLLGNGPAKQDLQELAAKLGVQNRVRFEPAVPTERVALWMSACDVFCLPSYAEGYPNATLEALRSGRPVVGTAVGGVPEQVGEGVNGLLVPPKDVGALAAALGAALGKDWDYAMIAAGNSRTWNEVAAETLDVCEEAIRRNSVAPH